MASGGRTYNADFFKKDKISSNSEDSVAILKVSKSFEEKLFIEDDSEEEVRDDDFNSSLDIEQFNNEDKIIAKLFREVVDEIMAVHKFEEWKVNNAISKIKEEIHLGHKKGFSRFLGIDFCKPENRCGYLRRYAICHTGLVKMAVWYFLTENKPFCEKARFDILNSRIRKVVSLGGGPGNDLIGFCSALQETHNNIKELDLKIVDISQGWESVFPSILRKAFRANFGSLSAFMEKVKINTSFLHRNLSESRIFEDETLCTMLGEVDVVLMVKLASFMSEREVEELIQNVVDCMKEGAYLIFIDSPFDKTFFGRIRGLDFIYQKKCIGYSLSFKPSRYQSPSISACQGNICIFCKELEEFTSEGD